MVRVRQGEALLEIAHHDGGVSWVHPVVGVPVAVVVATVSLLVDVVRVFKQRHPLRAVDDPPRWRRPGRHPIKSSSPAPFMAMTSAPSIFFMSSTDRV